MKSHKNAERELPEGWIECSIGQVTLPISKIDPKEKSDRTIDYIDISGIDNSRQVIGKVKQYRLNNAPSRARQIVRSGDVLFSTVRPYLRNIASVPTEYDEQIASTGFSVLRPAAGICPSFLFYKAISNDFVNALTGIQYGVSYPAVKDEQVRAQPIWIPPSREQLRIVDKIEELFSDLDKGVESLRTARVQLKVYRQAVLKRAFEGKLTAQWREKNKAKLETAEQLLARIMRERVARYSQKFKNWRIALKDWEQTGKSRKKPTKPKRPSDIVDCSDGLTDKLPQLPEGWMWVRVGDICDVVRGGSPRPAGDTRYYGGTIPFLKVADLTRTPGVYVDTYSFSIKQAGLRKTRLVDPPVLMLSNSGATLGVPKICRIRTTFNDGIAAFHGIEEDDLLYHYYFWASKTAELRSIRQGAAQPNLNTGLIRDVVIPLCSKSEMQIVARCIERSLSICDQMDATIDSQLAGLEALRQSILRKAFSGELVEHDPNDEPASALLERIKAEKTLQKPRIRTRKCKALSA